MHFVFQETKILAILSGKTVISSIVFLFFFFLFYFYVFAQKEEHVRQKEQLKKVKSEAFVRICPENSFRETFGKCPRKYMWGSHFAAKVQAAGMKLY